MRGRPRGDDGDRERLAGRSDCRGDVRSDEARNDEDSDDEDTGCLFGALDKPRDWQDVLSQLALFAVLAGLVLACVGYLFPRDYKLDPRLSAREKEAVELYYWRLGQDLDTVLLVGMGLIGLGGLMTSFLFFLAVVWPDCKRRRDPETVALTSFQHQTSGSDGGGGNYGATSSAPGN